ncbi:MAG TPA: hypothetical protein VE959_16845 [Bryobacteraceae bacterium]|nr:hypothetical protein [Bryobacteraceae bacterium]
MQGPCGVSHCETRGRRLLPCRRRIRTCLICPTQTSWATPRIRFGPTWFPPRTLDGVRGPWQQYFDGSIQKNFYFSEGKRRLQFRMDALNALNHPAFAVYPNNAGGADFMGAPSTATLSTAAYNSWAAANNQPAYSTTAGAAIYNQIVAMVNAQKTNNVLPASFFTIPLPADFYGKQPNSYDITTLQGYKLYQLRTAYATNFGTLYNSNTPRYVQFGVKLYF